MTSTIAHTNAEHILLNDSNVCWQGNFSKAFTISVNATSEARGIFNQALIEVADNASVNLADPFNVATSTNPQSITTDLLTSFQRAGAASVSLNSPSSG